MDGRRPDALSDSALDREVRAALNVEPSPEFVARIRMRVANEAIASKRSTGRQWLFASIGVAVAVLALVVFARDPANRERATTIGVVGDVRKPLEPPPGPASREPMAGEPSTQPVSPVAPAARGAAPPARGALPTREDETPPFADVLISPDEVRAYEMLLAAVRQGRLPPLTQRDVAAEAGALEIEIAPLIIEPLPAMARLE